MREKEAHGMQRKAQKRGRDANGGNGEVSSDGERNGREAMKLASEGKGIRRED